MTTITAIDGTEREIDPMHLVSGSIRGTMVLYKFFRGESPDELCDINQSMMHRIAKDVSRDHVVCEIAQKIVWIELMIFSYVHELEQKYHHVAPNANAVTPAGHSLGVAGHPQTNPVRFANDRERLYDQLGEHYQAGIRAAVLGTLREQGLIPASHASQ